MKKLFFIIIATICALSLKAEAATVDLVWEANTRAYPEYQGKPLATPEAGVKVVAVPWIEGKSGNFIPASELWFWWHKDEKPIKELSGLGKNSFTYLSKPAGNNQIGVVVRDGDYNELARALVNIPVSPTQVNFYEEDSVLGVLYHKVLSGSYQLVKPETTFVAEPLFYSTGHSLRYAWKVADRDGVPDSGNPRSITISLPPSGGEGSNVLTLSASNAGNALQTATQKINLIFNTNYGLFNENTF